MKWGLFATLVLFFSTLFLCGCDDDRKVDGAIADTVAIFPDYRDVTIPYNIAPLNFCVVGHDKALLQVSGGDGSSIQVETSDGCFRFNRKEWRKLLENNKGGKLKFTVLFYNRTNCLPHDGGWVATPSFEMCVAKEPVDPWISYRLIPPGYELWNSMGIYQRNMETFEQHPIYENIMTRSNCVNCHSYCMQNPDKMLFHVRAKYGATVMINDEIIEKLNTKTDSTVSALVYPSWHPSGRFVAFSVNNTMQNFHGKNLNRVEVYDGESDVVVYDVANHSIMWSPLTKSAKSFETFPTFSPDGKSLYFCSANAVDSVMYNYKKVRYSLCRISFDARTGRFGDSVDTLYNAEKEKRSVSFPRVSPDGRLLVFTLHDYGNFSIWHREADLYAIDLQKNAISPLSAANSDDVESYHSWSSNSRWIVFSSRRLDGLYTRPFVCYVGRDGKARKPFLLPQKNPRKFYDELMFSYNIPEFMKGKVKISQHTLSRMLRNEKGIDVRAAAH